MIYAQIKDGVIKNTIVLKDDSLLDLFRTDPMTGVSYDSVRLIEHLYPRPGIGWTFDEIMFAPPVLVEQTDDLLEE